MYCMHCKSTVAAAGGRGARLGKSLAPAQVNASPFFSLWGGGLVPLFSFFFCVLTLK